MDGTSLLFFKLLDFPLSVLTLKYLFQFIEPSVALTGIPEKC